jgi:hypothetical protein
MMATAAKKTNGDGITAKVEASGAVQNPYMTWAWI